MVLLWLKLAAVNQEKHTLFAVSCTTRQLKYVHLTFCDRELLPGVEVQHVIKQGSKLLFNYFCAGTRWCLVEETAAAQPHLMQSMRHVMMYTKFHFTNW